MFKNCSAYFKKKVSKQSLQKVRAVAHVKLYVNKEKKTNEQGQAANLLLAYKSLLFSV